MYEVCQRKIQESTNALYAKKIFQIVFDEYGDRAKKAEKNKGIDWKAVSHAIRAGLQLKELINTNNIIYPLKDREFIRDVKLGKYSYFCIAIYLDNMIDELEELNKNSNFPDEPDYEFWNNFLIEIIDGEFLRK